MKIVIYYFSATGNTRLVAEHLAEEFEEQGNETILRKVEGTDGTTVAGDLEGCDMMGIGSPVFGGGTPGIVTNFIKRLPETNHVPAFIFRTAGDIVQFNHASSVGIIRRLRKKGYDVFHERIFAMGSNWLIEYDYSFVKLLYSVVPEKARHMAGELKAGTKRFYKPSRLLVIITSILNFLEEKIGARIFGLTLHVNKSCTKCGLCVKNCPVGNISISEKVRVGSRCLMCMRCVYSCPAGAIKSRGMGFCILPNGYDIKKIISTEYGERSLESGGYMKHFREYLKDRSL